MNILVSRVEMVKRAAKITTCKEDDFRLYKSHVTGYKYAFYLKDVDMVIDITGNILTDRNDNVLHNRNSDRNDFENFVSTNMDILSKAFITSLREHPIIEDIRTFAHEIEDLLIPDTMAVNVVECSYSEKFAISIMKQNKNAEDPEEYSEEVCNFDIPYVPNDTNDFVFRGEIDQSINNFIRVFMDTYSVWY